VLSSEWSVCEIIELHWDKVDQQVLEQSAGHGTVLLWVTQTRVIEASWGVGAAFQ